MPYASEILAFALLLNIIPDLRRTTLSFEPWAHGHNDRIVLTVDDSKYEIEDHIQKTRLSAEVEVTPSGQAKLSPH